MGELECPWCERWGVHRCLRVHDEGIEYECTLCYMRHTRREGLPDAFAFFPEDVHALLVRDDPGR